MLNAECWKWVLVFWVEVEVYIIRDTKRVLRASEGLCERGVGFSFTEMDGLWLHRRVKSFMALRARETFGRLPKTRR